MQKRKLTNKQILLILAAIEAIGLLFLLWLAFRE
jgi:hypothetical protein